MYIRILIFQQVYQSRYCFLVLGTYSRHKQQHGVHPNPYLSAGLPVQILLPCPGYHSRHKQQLRRTQRILIFQQVYQSRYCILVLGTLSRHKQHTAYKRVLIFQQSTSPDIALVLGTSQGISSSTVGTHPSPHLSAGLPVQILLPCPGYLSRHKQQHGVQIHFSSFSRSTSPDIASLSWVPLKASAAARRTSNSHLSAGLPVQILLPCPGYHSRHKQQHGVHTSPHLSACLPVRILRPCLGYHSRHK